MESVLLVVGIVELWMLLFIIKRTADLKDVIKKHADRATFIQSSADKLVHTNKKVLDEIRAANQLIKDSQKITKVS